MAHLADPHYLWFRPSSLATAAVLVVLNNTCDVQTDMLSFYDALQDLYSPHHLTEVSPNTSEPSAQI